MMKYILLILIWIGLILTGSTNLLAQERKARLDRIKVMKELNIKGTDRTSFFDSLNTDNQITTKSIEDSNVTFYKLSSTVRAQLGGNNISAHAPDDDTIDLKIVGVDTTIRIKPSHNAQLRSDMVDSQYVFIGDKNIAMRTHIQNNNIFNVKDWGALDDYNSITKTGTNCATAFQEAIDSCTSQGGYVYAEGDYYTTATIKLTCNADMRFCTIYADTSFIGNVLEVEHKDGAPNWLVLTNTHLPSVMEVAPDFDWSYTNCGIRLTGLRDSQIFFNPVYYFKTGVHVTSWASALCGCSYNNFYLSEFRNSLTCLLIAPGSGGFTNENNWFGGRLRLDSGYAGTDQEKVCLKLTGNQNIFYKLCVEGDADSIKIYFDGSSYGSSYNSFYDLRPEKGTGKWNMYATGDVKYNNFYGGYIHTVENDINYSESVGTNAIINFYLNNQQVIQGGDANGVLQLMNDVSDAHPIIAMYSLHDSMLTNPSSYVSSINSTGFTFKSYYSYAYPYIKADPVLKGLRINMGGSLDIDNSPYIKCDHQGTTGYYLGLKGEPVMIGDGLIIGDGITTEIDSVKTIAADSIHVYIGAKYFPLKGY